jgi:hypothetical protein
MRFPLLSLLSWLCVACDGGEPAVVFEVARVSPVGSEQGSALLLNEAITIYFTAPVQPLSVTSDSVLVVDAEGHQVPGALRLGPTWVSFVPNVPLRSDLSDGSFIPGGRYRLVLAGNPRPDALRSQQGRRLPQTEAIEFEAAAVAPPGLPAPLRPPATELPFVQHTADALQQIPVDAPRLQIHFSQPVLPGSASSQAIEVMLIRQPFVELAPRSVHLVTASIDSHPGSTLEIDLGASPRRAGSGEPIELQPGDWISVSLRGGPGSLRDYSGNEPLLTTTQCWGVVAGATVPIASWPAQDERVETSDPMLPGFEVRNGLLRPRVRRDTGNGRLGVLRPKRDLMLRPGAPFDQGDGVLAVGDGPVFAFESIEIPAGVTVTIDASHRPVRLLSCGGVRIAGSIELIGEPVPLPARRSPASPVEDLAAVVPVSIIAAGDVEVLGVVRSQDRRVALEGTRLMLATVARMRLRGELPFGTILALEAGGDAAGGRLEGSRGQSLVHEVTFQHGVASGADFLTRGQSTWRQLPADADAAVLDVLGAVGVEVAWQSTSPHPARHGEPDLSSGRLSRWQPVDGTALVAAMPSALVRIELTARVREGQAIPELREVRLRRR